MLSSSQSCRLSQTFPALIVLILYRNNPSASKMEQTDIIRSILALQKQQQQLPRRRFNEGAPDISDDINANSLPNSSSGIRPELPHPSQAQSTEEEEISRGTVDDDTPNEPNESLAEDPYQMAFGPAIPSQTHINNQGGQGIFPS